MHGCRVGRSLPAGPVEDPDGNDQSSRDQRSSVTEYGPPRILPFECGPAQDLFPSAAPAIWGLGCLSSSVPPEEELFNEPPVERRPHGRGKLGPSGH
jgi:hypothetical protein